MSRSLYSSWPTSWLIKPFDKKIETLGMVEALKNLITETKTKIRTINKSKNIANSIENKPMLVISNHPSEAEVLFLLAQMSSRRKDVYLVANSGFLNILPHIDSHILPVHIGHKIEEEGKFNLKFRLLKLFHKSENLDYEAAHQKNIESITRAGEIINNGGVVIIFPMAASKDGSFQSGVGHILKNLKNPKDVEILMVHFRGTSTWDYFRVVPLIRRLIHPVIINFAPLINAGEIKKSEAKTMALKLQEKYYAWVENFTK